MRPLPIPLRSVFARGGGGDGGANDAGNKTFVELADLIEGGKVLLA